MVICITNIFNEMVYGVDSGAVLHVPFGLIQIYFYLNQALILILILNNEKERSI